MAGSSSIYCRLRIDCSIAQGEMGAMPLEVGGKDKQAEERRRRAEGRGHLLIVRGYKKRSNSQSRALPCVARNSVGRSQ